MYILNLELGREFWVKKLFASLSQLEDFGGQFEVGDVYWLSRNGLNFGVIVKINPGSIELIDSYN